MPMPPPPPSPSTLAPILTPPPSSTHQHFHSPVLPSVLAATGALVFFVVFAVVYRKLSNKRTAPADLQKPPQPQRFSYSLLRRATGSFAETNRIGQGGFGSVFKGTLPSGQEIAVKLMDASGSLQGEREFHNELSLASSLDTTSCPCPHVVSILGFSSDEHDSKRHCSYGRRKRPRLVLVYEYMHNGNLQDALLDRKCPELMIWKKRFSIITSVAKGIEYLHDICDPPIVHGDIKPSNILLDLNLDAKISDFGLAQALSRDEILEIEDEGKKEKNIEDNGSIIEENESVMTEDVVVVNVDQSPEPVEASPSDALDSKTIVSEGFDRISVDSGLRKGIGRRKSESGRDWWWKQENVNGGSESGRIKDYVMEWIGNEIKKERPKKDWIENKSTVDEKKQKKRLDWWPSQDDDEATIRKEKKKKNRKPREWWKEEFCEELSNKKKKKKKNKRGHKYNESGGDGGELWWEKDDDDDDAAAAAATTVPERKKRKNRGSLSSIDWWVDGFSGEFRIGRRNSQDWGGGSGEIPKSGGGISSTPSMRGTVCYIAPEYGGGGQASKKCDVYSFGVLLLVIVSGRRPLQVTASPMSEFERANLISWARQLAYNGRLLDLVDPNIQSLNREEALMCITIALLCLQRSPGNRPAMKDIVGMLSGESDPPNLPFEFSPSPPSNFPFESRKKPTR